MRWELRLVVLPPPGLVDRPSASIVGELELETSGRTTHHPLTASDLQAGEKVLTGIPVGAYRWRLNGPNRSRVLPRSGVDPEWVSVVTNGTDLVLDLGATATLEIEVLDAQGAPYSGALRVQLTKRLPGGAELFGGVPLPPGAELGAVNEVVCMPNWHGPPYIAYLIPPVGDVEVSAVGGADARSRSSASAARLDAGRTSALRLTLAD